MWGWGCKARVTTAPLSPHPFYGDAHMCSHKKQLGRPTCLANLLDIAHHLDRDLIPQQILLAKQHHNFYTN